jgi:predicted PurR-regulated permease PerM
MTPNSPLRDMLRILLSALFILGTLLACLWILRPFLSALIWAALIVVATWPVLLSVQKALWGKRGLATVMMTGAMLLVVVLPLAFAGLAIADHADDAAARLKQVASAGIPAAPGWLEGVPVVGAKLSAQWQAMAALGPEALQAKLAPHVKDIAAWMLAKAGGLAGFLLHLVLTAILAAVLYSTGETATTGLRAFALRLGGVRGDQSVTLAGQAVRGVALGVVVTAIVQSVLGGIGLALASVPFAMPLTLLMFVLAVAQIGPVPVLLCVVAWLFWSGNTLTAWIFLPWAIFVGVLDNFLRPILIKRGADLPLLLIFAGVIGGLLGFGIVGLFVGPVVLAIAYTQLSAWVTDSNAEAAAPPPAP